MPEYYLLKMNNKRQIIFVLLWGMSLLPANNSLASDRITLSAGADYSTGKYGSSDETKIWYLPLSVKFEQTDIVYKLTVPYLQITGPGNIIGSEANPAPGNNNGTATESGQGDIIAALSYSLTPYRPEHLFIEIGGKIKIPTADEEKRLGTGEYDYSLQLDSFFSVGKSSIFATLGYKIYGDPEGVDYRNIYYYSLGGSHRITPRFSSGLVYDFKQAATSSGVDQQELTFFASSRLDNKKKILFYLVKGLSDGSPDWGIGINLGYVI